MTISSTDRIAGPFAGDDLTTVFPFTFKVFDEDELLLVQLVVATGVETTLVLTTDYTVSLNADQNANPGGNVTLNAALATGTTLTVTSDADQVQETDLQNQGGFLPNVIENALDRGTIIDQQQQGDIDRCLKLPLSSESEADVPMPVADTVLGFDDSDPPELRTYTGAQLVALVPEDVELMVLVSDDDDTAAFLEDKISAGTNISLATVSTGVNNETVQVSVSKAIPSPASSTPLVDSGAGAVGTGTDYARNDHVHPISAPDPTVSNITHDVDTTYCPTGGADAIYLTIEDDGGLGTTWNMLFSGMTPGKPIWVFIDGFLDSAKAALPSSLSRTGMTIPLVAGDFFYLMPTSATAYRMIDGTVGVGRFVPLSDPAIITEPSEGSAAEQTVTMPSEIRKGAVKALINVALYSTSGVPYLTVGTADSHTFATSCVLYIAAINVYYGRRLEALLNDDKEFKAKWSVTWTASYNEWCCWGYWI